MAIVKSSKPTQKEKKLLVSSNCQTETLAEALAVMLPHFEITKCQIPVGNTNLDYLLGSLSDIDILVTSNPLCDSEEFSKPYSKLEIMKVPQVVFSAFHPDTITAVLPDDTFFSCLETGYHSGICLWAWKNGLSPEEATKLFSKETYFQLGYLNCWEDSVTELKKRFRECRLDFTTFWQSVSREGIFMHTFDHPKVLVLAEIASQIARNLGADKRILSEPNYLILSDMLTANRWPIYPEIAEQYGVSGMYKWKIRKSLYLSLEEYVQCAFLSYQESMVRKEDVKFYSNGYDDFNKVLMNIRSSL